MRKVLIVVASTAVGIALGACATSSATPPATAGTSVTPPPPGTISASTPAAASATWKTNLQSMNGTNVTGSASVSPAMNGGATASVSIQGATPGEAHPWHVHSGTCATGGGVVGPASAYPLLAVSAGGTASATANLPSALDPTQSYHVNIHKSPTDMGTIIACGDLSIPKG